MSDDAHERLLSDRTEVEESTDIAKMPVDWSFEAERLIDMTAEEKARYDIEFAEKTRRLAAGLESIAKVLTNAGVRYEGESPQEILDKLLNPDRYLTGQEEVPDK